jgi:hypothetical protein
MDLLGRMKPRFVMCPFDVRERLRRLNEQNDLLPRSKAMIDRQARA